MTEIRFFCNDTNIKDPCFIEPNSVIARLQQIDPQISVTLLSHGGNKVWYKNVLYTEQNYPTELRSLMQRRGWEYQNDIKIESLNTFVYRLEHKDKIVDFRTDNDISHLRPMDILNKMTSIINDSFSGHMDMNI